MYRNLVGGMAIVMILLGLAMLSFTLRHGCGVGVVLGPALRRRWRRPALDAAKAFVVASKLPGLRRELDARALFSVAYGEIASSIYFALGVLAAHALGFTPLVLLGVGLLFLIVSLSYAEGTAALPETGGAATFVRRALNDLAGFLTGWALFLDYLIVIALPALFLPHYLSGAFQIAALDRKPLGRRRRRRRDRARRDRAPRPAAVAVRLRDHRPGARPVHAAPSRRARLRPRLLSGTRSRTGMSLGHAADLARDRVLAAARDARVHRPRDGREPRRGGAPPGRRPAPLALRRHRDRRPDLRR